MKARQKVLDRFKNDESLLSGKSNRALIKKLKNPKTAEEAASNFQNLKHEGETKKGLVNDNNEKLKAKKPSSTVSTEETVQRLI